jgi:hypothetical protein
MTLHDTDPIDAILHKLLGPHIAYRPGKVPFLVGTEKEIRAHLPPTRRSHHANVTTL